MPDLHVVILAAGKGTRMKSSVPKVLHRVAGRRMLDHVWNRAQALSPRTLTIVIGYLAESVRRAFPDRTNVQFVVQEPQLGTGHALLQAAPLVERMAGALLLLSGDVPLLSAATLERLLRAHESSGAAATVLTARVDRPYGYGRVIRVDGQISRIVEERDASPAERQIKEVNSGIYVFALKPLFPALRSLAAKNAQGEYYLPDLIRLYRRQQRGVETITLEQPDEVLGINSHTELAEVSRIVRQKKNEELMAAGVTIEDPATTYVDPDVQVGPDTVIHPGVHLEGQTQVGAACEIHAGVRIVDSVVEDRVTIKNFCVIQHSRIASGATVGPFAHLRPETEIRQNARVGNFVELKKTVLGTGSKANHLSYLGDTTIGADVNVGAGTITCNYDGAQKHATVIEDGAFIGSDTQLIAPVTVGRGAYVAAGSSITDNVPPGALGIARGRQVNKEGWAEGKKKKKIGDRR
jgi:bifunctional UDP-N-acetylglucosamine pyrophosphorylase/glucosamine-1-phosphate N-acetyltransferase